MELSKHEYFHPRQTSLTDGEDKSFLSGMTVGFGVSLEEIGGITESVAAMLLCKSTESK